MARTIQSLGAFALDINTFKQAALTKAKRISNLIEDGLNEGTATWKNKPVWRIVRKDYSFEMTTVSAIYVYVNEGTRPHTITARNGRSLRFRSKYRAKTTVGSKGSRYGGSYGPVRYAKSVRHPGTAPRKFTTLVADEATAALGIFADVIDVVEVKVTS
jgi:hypothetical protein